MPFRAPAINTGYIKLPDPNQNFTAAQKLFSGISDRIKGRARNKAINEVLGTYEADGTNLVASQQGLTSQLSGIEGMDPVTALGLSSKMMDPVYKQMTYDKGQYGFQTDELGNAYSFNKNDGSYDQVANSPYGAGAINPKHIVMKPVTNTDSSGVSTTTQVPFNKTTGQVVDFSGPDAGYENAQGVRVDGNGNPLNISVGNAVDNPPMPVGNSGVGTKYPTVAQGDKGYADDMPGINNNLAELDQIVNNPSYEDSFGAIDKWTGLVGSMFGTDDGVKQTESKALISNLLAGFGKAQMAGVLTDQDMKIIKQQIPDVGDNPKVAQEKMKFIVRMMQDKNQAYIDRMNKSNPGFLGADNNSTYSSPDTNSTAEQPKAKEPYTLEDGTIVFSDGSMVKDGRRVR